MNRRTFLSASLSTAAAFSLPHRNRAQASRPPRILLRSGWQSVNIGDIGHTPGALSMLEKYLPEAEVTLWANKLGHGARELMAKHFPRVKIIEPGHAREGASKMPEIEAAWAETDFLLHGSGSGFPAKADVAAFRKATGKPAGVWAVSTDPIYSLEKQPEGGTLAQLRAQIEALPSTHINEQYRALLDGLAFMFTRDSLSLDYLKAQGIKTPILEFGPDAQIAMRARDDSKAAAYMQASGLEEGKFICAIPRLRWTPYHRMEPQRKGDPAENAKKDAVNERTRASDHAALREVIIRYIRETGNKVLTCPEMTYEMELAKEQLVDPLPADVKKNVVWRENYWGPDEAASVYAKALTVLSLECHSPLIAYQHHTPAFHIRQPTDTCKGHMYRDLGAGDWLFEVEETSGDQLWTRLEPIVRDPAAGRAKTKALMAEVEKKQQRMAEALRAALARA
jgi:hypothetical protein